MLKAVTRGLLKSPPLIPGTEEEKEIKSTTTPAPITYIKSSSLVGSTDSGFTKFETLKVWLPAAKFPASSINITSI